MREKLVSSLCQRKSVLAENQNFLNEARLEEIENHENSKENNEHEPKN